MFRLLAVITTLAFCGPPALAESFLDRRLIITDGRSDRAVPAPLVVVMHGFLGTGSNMRKKTGFDALARREGFVVAYPNGPQRRWNDGRIARSTPDDAGYLAALIDALIADGVVDRNRIFLTGHSNGGGMAMRMACDRPDLIRGISVIATKSSTVYQCGNGTPVPALFVHGTRDPISPHAGRSGDRRLGGALSSAATIKLWQQRNRCKGSPRVETTDRTDDGTSVTLFQHRACSAPLWFVLIEGHGHDWPNGAGRATLLQGPATREVDAAQVSWSFFERL